MGRKDVIEQAVLGVRDNLTYLIKKNNFLEDHNNIDRKIAEIISVKTLLEDEDIHIGKDVLVDIIRAYTDPKKQYSKEYELILHFPRCDETDCTYSDHVGGIALARQIDNRYEPVNGKLVLAKK